MISVFIVQHSIYQISVHYVIYMFDMFDKDRRACPLYEATEGEVLGKRHCL